MNKQQLAAKIWASANRMRSKIEANEYKDYILGFIFYKFLSEYEVQKLKKEAYWSDDDIEKELNEEHPQHVRYCQNNFGYFIAHKHLFSTWLKKGIEFTVGDVTDALNAFERLISPEKNKNRVFRKIFKTLSDGLSKLGGTPAERTKAIRKLLRLIKEIPTAGTENYDVLGFIYEYLIENFAANAGKKAGEFYTPHEVSLLMAEIVAEHLKGRNHIDIYDPTSGSGSLLINIGRAVAKYTSEENVNYYAQELKENTYNLTRMNLVMRGIDADRIMVRNGDTLENDWPLFEENEEGQIDESTYYMLPVDAVVSNPPYSQSWNPKGKKEDPRFKQYGVAPRGKADYAFLLHDLCHIKDDGIVTIVLPHGVLFRPGEDYKIRRNLIEANKIDAIIGLPADIFYGTGIATLIMILKKQRSDTEDVLIIDASHLSIKDGKKNKLTASDIRHIVDTVVNRKEEPKFSCLVSREDIRNNDYNLNIPRYVDSSASLEEWDAYATVFGNIPEKEIDMLQKYWKIFPSLRNELYSHVEGTPCACLNTESILETINSNQDVIEWQDDTFNALKTLPKWLNDMLLCDMMTLNLHTAEKYMAEEVYLRLKSIPLIDRYNAYQIIDDQWDIIRTDLEMLQSEGFGAARVVEKNMVFKKSTNDDDEEFEEEGDGWKGRILPFDLVQRIILNKEYEKLLSLKRELEEQQNRLSSMMDELSEEDREEYLNEDNTDFDMKKISKGLIDAFACVETEELSALNDYMSLLEQKPKKTDKVEYVKKIHVVNWKLIEISKDGTYSKKAVQRRINDIRFGYQFPKDSTEALLVKISAANENVKYLKRDVSQYEKELEETTKNAIENLSDKQVLSLLHEKWISPLYIRLCNMTKEVVLDVTKQIEHLNVKYQHGLVEVENQINKASKELLELLNKLKVDGSNRETCNCLKQMLNSGMYEEAATYSAERMFPRQGEAIPCIRFEGFIGDWEEQKLSKFAQRITRKNEKLESDLALTISAQHGLIAQEDFFNRRIASSQLQGYYLIKKGEFAYNKSYSAEYPVGAVKSLTKYEMGVLSTLYIVFSLSPKVNPDWITYYFETPRWHPEILKRASEGARNHGLLNISANDFFDIPILLPKDKAEQDAIAAFFISLDALISAQTEKVNKLRALKKAFLGNLFIAS